LDRAKIFALSPSHASPARAGLVFVAEQVERPVNGEQPKLVNQAATRLIGLFLRPLRGDNDVAEDMRIDIGEFALSHRESEHVGRRIDLAVLPVELLHPRVADYEHADFGVDSLLTFERSLNRRSDWRDFCSRS
jgi:hypothetical protein